ncbi:MAG: hypothetical protein HYS05_02875 [Acidobacteria bacterium]|nr:hypothetical protein [Acidobacteriota bacterium]
MVASVLAGSERGAALISVLLLLIIMSALSAALTISTRTEVMVARNRQSSAQARAAAEAALNHASDVTITNLRLWNANGFASPSAAITGLLRGPDNQTGTVALDADNGSLENLGIPRPPARLGLNNLPGVGYEARVFDEDDSGRGLTLSAADRASIGEDGNATNDGNRTILVRSIGYANDGTQLTIEAAIIPVVLPAILTGGDLRLDGNVTVAGTSGSVHTNEDLRLDGSSIVIAEDATATGTYSTTGNPVVGGIAGGGQPTVSIPPVRAADYRNVADFILTSDGRVTNQAGAVLCNASADPNACQVLYGWRYDGPGWSITAASAPVSGTFYVEGPVDVRGTSAVPRQITIIAQGSIDISSGRTFSPETPDLMFVTDGDLEVTGEFGMAPGVEGRILVHEQIEIGGNVNLFGQITAEGAANASNLVTSNRIHIGATVTYNGQSGADTFVVGAWREVR